MNSLMKSTGIVALCFLSLCLGQTAQYNVQPLNLEVGTSHTFEFLDDGVHVGYNHYSVVKQEQYNGMDAYFIESETEIESEEVTLHIEAMYIVDTSGRCLHYEFEGTIDGQLHTVTADFSEKSVQISASRPDANYSKTIELTVNTLCVDNNMIGMWDLMFSAVAIVPDKTFAANVFAPQPMEKGAIRASVGEIPSLMEAAGKSWSCYTLTFSAPEGYVAYVTQEGQLIKLETPSGLTIVLTE
ncbi:MAG: hypothetical protein HXS41_02200 [Theionarchaea archaeon]|nr:hypothetical protein [Theionarchaea archaeon]MBU7001234.1 hypothetical protein [Theionarchaea archaeon]MBU7019843.1 hypothetical protein [Theionarchaea archaeon]MBU7036166.1 hypothetical protein [Theionarchaea archaeon]